MASSMSPFFRFSPRVRGSLVRFAGSLAAVVASLGAVAVLLLALGKDPIYTYVAIATGAFGSWFSLSEALVAATPLMFCALSVAFAARLGLMSIGAEGQLYLGATAATLVALKFSGMAAWQLIPSMAVAAAVVGAVWSGVPGLLRTRLGMNETITTLLLNYIAILLVQHLLHGPWRDPASFGWPQTQSFSDTAQLSGFAGTRLHAGILVALAIAGAFAIILSRTKAGHIIRVIGANPSAAKYAHYPVDRYLVIGMLVSGAVAALAGFSQVSGIEGRLRSGISPGYGYTGFLVSWLSRHNPIAIVAVSILMGGLLSGGDALQLTAKLPFATINVIQGTIFLVLLSSECVIRRLATSVANRP